MKKLIYILILCLTTTAFAADTKTTALAELTAVADADLLYIIDDVAGTPTSKRITVLNLFDTIDTFAELNTITSDKTLVNEEDTITFDAIITFATAITLSDAATIDQSANNYIDFLENSDTLQFYFDATDVALLWSDGALTLRNAENAVDAIVQISGKDAGEKGILRVRSDGDDKYIELHNDDTDAVITNSAGNIIINPVGLGVVIGDNGNEDYTLTFDGDTSDGVLNYDEDNADFEFDQDVITTGVFYAPAFDAPGAEDMDYGSADITDHTFTTDDMTLIMDGGITVSTGDFIKIGTTQWNSADEIDGTKIKDADYGDVAVSAGGAWTLDGDAVDESHIADNGIDSEHYNDGSIDLVHLAAAAYAKDLVTTAPITGATDNIFVGADSDVTVAITLLKDVVATSPMLIDGGTNVDDILPGADADLTISATILKDLVTTSPVTGATNDCFLGTDADLTIALDFTTAWNFGSAAGSEWVNDGAPTTDAAGEIALDTTIADHQPLWQYYDGGENMTIIAIDTAQLPALDNEIVKYDAGSDKFVLEADIGANTLYDAIVDPSASGSISFDAAEAGVYTSADDEWVGITISNTQADNAGDTELLTLAFTDDGDTNSHYLIMSDAAGTQQLEVIQSTADIQITTAGDLKFVAGGGDFNFADDTITTSGTVEGGTITEGGAGVPNLTEGGTFTGNIIANANLSVGNAATTAGVLTLLEDDDDGAHFASFMVPALTASTVYTLPPDDGDNTEVLQTDGSGALTWVANTGATKWNTIIDADGVGSVDFVTYTQTIDIGKSDSGGGSGLILDVTGLGAGADDVIALEITTATNDDTDYIPIAIYDDSGGDNDLLFKIDTLGFLHLSNAASISNDTDNKIQFYENNDAIWLYFDATDCALLWSDGVLNIRNQENSVDGIVQIAGRDGGEKGILRVMSDGDDNYIELHHDDTDGHIITDTGDIHIEAAGGDISFADDNLNTTGAVDFGGAASVEITNSTDPDVDAVGEISIDTDGGDEPNDISMRTFEGAGTQYVLARTLKTLNFTLISPDTIDAADLIPVWHNTSGYTFTIIEWKAWSDDDNVSFEIEELTSQTDYTARTTVDAVEIATDGTGVYYASDTTITHAAIEHDHSMAIDFDTSDTPDYVQIAITGWFNGDVN